MHSHVSFTLPSFLLFKSPKQFLLLSRVFQFFFHLFSFFAFSHFNSICNFYSKFLFRYFITQLFSFGKISFLYCFVKLFFYFRLKNKQINAFTHSGEICPSAVQFFYHSSLSRGILSCNRKVICITAVVRKQTILPLALVLQCYLG